MNTASISGNLARDPELRTTQGGTQVLTFTVVVNDRKRDPQSGKWIDVPNYIPCVMFGNRAESVSRFVSKGSKVACQGKLRWSSYQGKDGQKRNKIEVVVDEIEFMSRQNDSQAQNGQQGQQTNNYSNYGQNAANSGSQPPQDAYYDDDCPF